MRSKVMLFVVACFGLPFLQCSSDDSASPAASTDAGADVTDSAVNQPDSAIADSAPTTLTLDGTLDSFETTGVLASRKVVIVDANDNVTEATTDASGKFHATGIMPPYDVSIPYEVPDAAAGVYPFFYSGLTVANPVVGGDPYVFSSHPTNMTTVQFTTTICNGCQLTLSGNGFHADPVAGTGSSQVFSIVYQWYTSATSAAFHLVVADGTTGAYTNRAEIPATALVAGGTTAITPTFTAITSGTFALTTTLPASYTYGQGGLYVENTGPTDYSDFMRADLATVSATAKYPVIPGASVFVTLRAGGPNGEESDGYLMYPIASTPASAAITLLTAPQLTTPANNATAVSSTESLTWSSFGTDSIYQVQVDTPSSQLVILTTGTSVSLARLAKAEIGLAPATQYTWTNDAATNEASTFGTPDNSPTVTTFYEGESASWMFTTQ